MRKNTGNKKRIMVILSTLITISLLSGCIHITIPYQEKPQKPTEAPTIDTSEERFNQFKETTLGLSIAEYEIVTIDERKIALKDIRENAVLVFADIMCPACEMLIPEILKVANAGHPVIYVYPFDSTQMVYEHLESYSELLEMSHVYVISEDSSDTATALKEHIRPIFFPTILFLELGEIYDATYGAVPSFFIQDTLSR